VGKEVKNFHEKGKDVHFMKGGGDKRGSNRWKFRGSFIIQGGKLGQVFPPLAGGLETNPLDKVLVGRNVDFNK